MNRTRFVILGLAAILAMPAMATGTPPAAPDPVSMAKAGAKASSSAAVLANASSSSSSTSTSSAAVGAVGNVAPSQSIGGDSSRAWSLFLPPPAYTAPMAAVQGCAAEVTQEAGAITLLGSRATSRTDPSVCHVLALRNAKVEACHYASAKHVEDLLLAKLLPGYQASALVLTDLSPADCAALKAPAKPEPVVNYVAPPPTAATTPPGAAPALAACSARAGAPTRPKARKTAVTGSCRPV